MGYRLTLSFDIDEGGYGYEISPPETPMWMTVEVLLGFLEDIKRQYDAAPSLNTPRRVGAAPERYSPPQPAFQAR